MIHKILPVQSTNWRKNIRQYRKFNQENKNESKRFAEILASEIAQRNNDCLEERRLIDNN